MYHVYIYNALNCIAYQAEIHSCNNLTPVVGFIKKVVDKQLLMYFHVLYIFSLRFAYIVIYISSLCTANAVLKCIICQRASATKETKKKNMKKNLSCLFYDTGTKKKIVK